MTFSLYWSETYRQTLLFVCQLTSVMMEMLNMVQRSFRGYMFMVHLCKENILGVRIILVSLGSMSEVNQFSDMCTTYNIILSLIFKHSSTVTRKRICSKKNQSTHGSYTSQLHRIKYLNSEESLDQRSIRSMKFTTKSNIQINF